MVLSITPESMGSFLARTATQSIEAVTVVTLARMDVLEGYPRLYRREVGQAVLENGSIEAAMVYVMDEQTATRGDGHRIG